MIVCLLNLQWNPQISEEHWAFDPQAAFPAAGSWNCSRFQGKFCKICSADNANFLIMIKRNWCLESWIHYWHGFGLDRRIWGSKATRFLRCRKRQRLISWVCSRTPTFVLSMPSESPLCPRIFNWQGESEASVLNLWFLM